MAEEYKIKAVDLVEIADVIREKGNTTEQLVWPDGWKDAVQAIKSGVELNFEVIGGTAQPENPKENTIWVNTDQEITGWSFSENEPTSPAHGNVWFETNDNGEKEFNALTENEMIISPVAAKAVRRG